MAISLVGKNKAEVLMRLYNASGPQGMGMLHYRARDLTTEQAQELLDEGCTYFDYLHGRVMKVDLEGDELDTRLYDRDNGEGAAQRALEGL